MFRDHDNSDEMKRFLDRVVNPINLGCRAEGRFKVRRMKGNVILQEVEAVEESGWSKNLLVNTWFNDKLGNAPGVRWFTGFVCGAGTNTPAVTDVAMQSYLGGGNSLQSATRTIVANVAPRHMKIVLRYRGNEGAVVGNVSEVGLYWSSVSTNTAPSNSVSLVNRARIVDELGNPTSITVLSDEFLEVVYEVRFYAMEGLTGTLTINMPGGPQNFNYEIRPVSMNHTGSWSNSVGQVSGNGVGAYISGWPIVAGSNYSHSYVTGQTTFGDPESAVVPAGFVNTNVFTTRVAAAYVPNSRTRLFTCRLPLNNGNIASPGIRSINIGLAGQGDYDSWCMHQMLLSGPFQKVAGQIFDLPINVAMGNL